MGRPLRPLGLVIFIIKKESKLKFNIGLTSFLFKPLQYPFKIFYYFKDSNHDNIRLQPTCFQDDVSRMAGRRMEAQVGNQMIKTIAESKLLSFPIDKSAFMER